MNERFSAVDRIEDPIEAVGAGEGAQLFAHGTVAGELADNVGADQGFRLAIGDRHGRMVFLGFDPQPFRLVVAEDQLSGLARHVECEFEARLEVNGHGLSFLWEVRGLWEMTGRSAPTGTAEAAGSRLRATPSSSNRYSNSPAFRTSRIP